MGYGIIIAIILIVALVMYTYKFILVIAVGLYALIIAGIGALICTVIYEVETEDEDNPRK